MSDNVRVAVIGLGYVGSCLAATLADLGLDVVGVEADPRLVDELENNHFRLRETGLEEMFFGAMRAGRLRVTTDYAAVSTADVVLIAVGTPVHDDGALADGQLREASSSLSRHLRPGQLVVLKSTVPPGTTRDVVLPLLEGGGLVAGQDFLLAFTPERLAEGAALSELRRFPLVVGGLNEASAAAATQFWRRALGVRITPQESLEAAEIVKLADNWWIDLNIALANELAKFCDLYGVDVLDVIAAANTIPKGAGHVNILTPSVGVGGSCLTKDPWMVWQTARRRGVEIETAPAGRRVNDAMPHYAVQAVVEELTALGKEPAASSVAVLGLSFKNDTGDLRATPAKAFITALRELGVQVRGHDPLVNPAWAKDSLGIQPAGTCLEAVQDADCVAILAYHREFADLDFANLPVRRPCLVFDGRAYFPQAKIAELRRLGYAYRGVGR